MDGAPSQVKVTPPPLVIVDNSSRPRKVFERAEVLGTGGFAQVYSVPERSSGIRYANKVINKDIFTGKKLEDLCPTSHNLEVPFVKRTEYQLLNADPDSGEVSLLLESGDTKDD